MLDHTKKRIAYIIAFSNVFNAMAIDLYLPALPDIKNYFCTSEFKSQLIVSAFYFGAIFSRLFWGPFSDIYGRKRAILAAYSIQAFFQIMCIFSPTIDFLIAMRIFQSIGAGVTGVIGIAIITDYFAGIERLKMLHLVEFSFSSAFLIAPTIGSILLLSPLDWRTGFVFIFLSFILSIYLFCRYLPKDKIIAKSSKKLHLFKHYIKMINIPLVFFSFLGGIFASLYMSVTLKAPFVYIERFFLTKIQYIFYQTLPILLSFLIFLSYKSIIKRIGFLKTIEGSILMLIFTSFTGILLISIHPQESYLTFFSIVIVVSLFTPFLITGFSSIAFEFSEEKGVASSINSSIRSLCLFLGMILAGFTNSFGKTLFSYVLFTSLFSLILWKIGKSLFTEKLSFDLT
jgi:DHA1 family bicyclomycin/chloramphenicol resistance-like MFS transporter